MRVRKLVIVETVLLISVFMFFLWMEGASAEQKSLDSLYASVGIQRITPPVEALDFTLKNLEGSEISLKDFEGKVVFLNFWATWAGICRSEMPAMKKLWQKFKEEVFVILAVDLREGKEEVRSFMKDYGLTFPVLLDSRGEVASMYAVRLLPTTYLLNPEGRIVGKALGARDWASEDAFDLIEHLLQAPVAQNFRFPLEGDWAPLWQDFNKWNSEWEGYHLGEDVGREDADRQNYPVYPMGDGVVKFADIVSGYTVIIEHKLPIDDPDGNYVCSVYYHMKRPGEGGIHLTVGTTVSMDSPIGYVSGKWKDHKSSPHLHFGIRKGRYKTGKDSRTGYWHYPGYTTIKKDGEVQKNPNDPTHQPVLADWFNPTTDPKNRTGFIERHLAQAAPVITSPLEITPPPYHVGDELNAQFTITNEGAIPITFTVLTVGGRDPDNQVADFTSRGDITLEPSESYKYKGSLTLAKAGKYHFFCAYQTRDGNWNTSIDLSSGLTDEDRIENIVVKVKEEEIKLIQLYFSDSQGQNLIPEERKILALPQINQEAKEILKELIKGPLDSSLKPTIPLHTEVRAVYVKGDRFYVDFSSSLREKHPGGSHRELLTVYSIVNTLLINFPPHSWVQILIQGKPAETLAGHIDIRSPLGMRLDIVKEEVKRIGPEKIFFKSFYCKDDFAEYFAEYPNWPSLPITEEIKEFYEKAGGKGIAVVKSKEMSVYIGVRRWSSPDEMTLLEGLRFAERHGQLSSASRILREQKSSNEDFIEAVIDNKEELGQAYATELSGSKIHILGKVLHYGNDTYFQVIVNVVEDKWSDYQDIALSVINSMRTEVTTKEAQEEEKKEKEQLFPYRVKYKPIVRSGFPFLLVDVRGPADELGIILTNPEGWSTTTFISKRDLIDNFESVEVFMCEGRNPPAGKYKLVIKTITPEKVVYKTEARFTPPAVEITNAELKLGKTGGVYWDTGMRYYTKEFSVTVKNSGELPIFLNKAVVIIPSSMSSKIQKIEITLRFAGVPYGETVIEDEGNYGYLESRGNPYGNKIKLYSEGKEVASSSIKVTVVE